MRALLRGVVVAALLVLAAPAASIAADYTVEYFQVPTRLSKGGQPNGIVEGRDGKIWFVEGGGKVGWVDDAGSVTELGPIGTPKPGVGAIAAGPDGNVWVTTRTGIGQLLPDGSVTLRPFSTDLRIQGVLTAGPDGNLWATDFRGPIARIAPASGESSLFAALPGWSGSSQIKGMVTGPDGNVWFTHHGGGKFFGPQPRVPSPTDIEASYETIGRITPSGEVTHFRLPGQQDVYPDQASAEKVRDAWGITAGSDGNLWFTRPPETVGRITPAGAITEFPASGDSANNGWITPGPDGNVWFAGNGGTIKNISPAGVVTSYRLPAGSNAARGLVFDARGRLWFTSDDDSKPIGVGLIGRITWGPERLLSGISVSPTTLRDSRLRVALSLTRPTVVDLVVTATNSRRPLAARRFTAGPGRVLKVVVARTDKRRWTPGRYVVTATSRAAGGVAGNRVTARFTVAPR